MIDVAFAPNGWFHSSNIYFAFVANSVDVVDACFDPDHVRDRSIGFVVPAFDSSYTSNVSCIQKKKKDGSWLDSLFGEAFAAQADEKYGIPKPPSWSPQSQFGPRITLAPMKTPLISILRPDSRGGKSTHLKWSKEVNWFEFSKWNGSRVYLDSFQYPLPELVSYLLNECVKSW